ncbi:hypothetical protein CIHG_04586 [Coccidioides immitis H538.4]|uniref:Uncharacterized protein n=1 Tax=Coccidioides immitis H538.4 TaxID=396776 RepID=A0A0J8RPQ3_COCIT|nr:hypothetical protein CIHG_04586 [Coccidioides immitis H538.4]
MPSDVSSPLHLAAFLYRGANLPSSLQNLYVDDEVNRQTLGFLWDDQVAYYNYTARLKLCGQELSLPATHKEMIRPAKPPGRSHGLTTSLTTSYGELRTSYSIQSTESDFCDVPAPLIEYFVESEYTTLKFLESTNVPSPRAFGFQLALDPADNVGISYTLMECLPGKSYLEPIASNDFLVLDRYGPFDDALQYFKSIADQYLDLIADRYRQLSGTEK